MSDGPFDSLAAWLHHYGAIIFGLLIGTIAHFGRKLSEGEAFSWRQTIGFLMQLGIVGLVASVATKEMGVMDTDMRALATAVLAISTQEVVQFVKRNAWGTITRAATGGDNER